MDALREIGTMGAAHASTALSDLVHRDIMVEVSDCFMCSTCDLPGAFEETDRTVVAVFLEAQGSGRGGIMLILSEEAAMEFSDLVLGRPYAPGEAMDEEQRDAICEIGNICASAYLSAVAQFLGTTLVPSPPGMARDMLRAILQYPAALIEEVSDRSLVIRTHFKYGNEVIYGFMLYLPDQELQEELLERFRLR